MKIIFALMILLTSLALADTKISNLPLLGGAAVGSTDTVPFVSFSNNETAQLRLSELFNIPSLQSPTFSGVLTAASIFGPLTGNVTGTASGNTTYTPNQYGLIYSSSGNVLSVLAPNASTVFPLLSGGASAAPSWRLLTPGGGGTGVANNSASTITITGSFPLTFTLGGSTSLTLPASGTVASFSGLTTHGLIVASSSTAAVSIGAGTSGQVATSNGSSSDPSMQTVPGNATILKAPTSQSFTSSSGTYTRPSAPSPLYIRVRLVGGGGGGGGSGVSGGTGVTGGNTTFGSSLLSGNGGTGGLALTPGAGGSASLGSGPFGIALGGGGGSPGVYDATTMVTTGGTGAASPFGGAGSGGVNTTAAVAGITNSGSGGGGAAAGSVVTSGAGGGGAGGFVDAIISAPSTTYSYAVGSGGTGGTAGTSGNAGGAGGSGFIIVEEFYQ